MNALKTNQQAEDDTWHAWSKYVLNELIEAKKCNKELSEKMTDLIVEMAVMKVKVGLWGFAGSAFGFIVMYLISRVKI